MMEMGFVEVFVYVLKIKEFPSSYTKFILAMHPTGVSEWIILITVIM